MIDLEKIKTKPPEKQRFRVIDYLNDQFYGLWDMGPDASSIPILMGGYEYGGNEALRQEGLAKMQYIVDALNIVHLPKFAGQIGVKVDGPHPRLFTEGYVPQ